MDNILKNLRETLERNYVITDDLLCQVITQFMQERNMNAISIMLEIEDQKAKTKIMGGLK